MADRAALRGALDDRRPSGSADEPPRHVSGPQPDDDLSYLLGSDSVVAVAQLHKLGDARFQQFMRELHAALKGAVQIQEPSTAVSSRDEPVAPATPLPHKMPDARLSEMPASLRSQARAQEMPPRLSQSRTSLQAEPATAVDLDLIIPAPDLEKRIRRAPYRKGRHAAAVVAAAFIGLLPMSASRAPQVLAPDRTTPQSTIRHAGSFDEARATDVPVTNDIGLATVPSATPQSFSTPETRTLSNAALEPKEIEMLIAQGDHFLLARDIASARSYYERAAAAGSRTAAFGLAKTFDANFLAQIGARGVRPDPERAAALYRAARDPGESPPEAQLTTRRPAGPD